MVNSPEVSWAAPPSPLPSPLGSPFRDAALPASPRPASFRDRLAELASEHEDLQARCDSLLAENRDLRRQLAAARGEGAGTELVAVATSFSIGEKEKGKEREKGKAAHSRAAGRVDTNGRADGAFGLPPRLALSWNPEGDLGLRPRSATRGEAHPGHNHNSLEVRSCGEDCEEGDSCSCSSSSFTEGHSHGRRHRRRKHHRRGSDTRHRRRRRHGRSRSRTHGASAARKVRTKASPGRGTVARGLYGCGDHRRDIEDFCMKNHLEARVISALKSMPESKQRKVMGTDGGENCYLLVDRVKNPNAVVMSRIRKIEAEM